ncbi:hypothetical protein FB45DRAFT_1008539 [Roridomyces roridus]|uniref:F-box domain-containing protein n=1 Tax=Roridomyces roridus TaxID=1738132 RepID=A0AAD7B9S0_9AGAR|nr:hypothetical protein FB45DRAFT_1008539 [Roridomyces roridus]
MSLAFDKIPHLPLELFALTIEYLTDKSDLLRCSLVCRGWLPFARGNLTISISTETSVTRLKDILACPENTLASTIRHLTLSEPDVETILPSLGSFTQLRSLRLWEMDAIDLPALASLTYLELDDFVHFDSCTSFLRFLSGTSNLQHLVLGNVSWDNDDPECALPALHLRSLQMWFHASRLDQRLMSTLHTKSLQLAWGDISASLDVVSKYLHVLGSDLESLQFVDLNDEGLNALSNLDFSASVNLVHLSVDGGVYYDEGTGVASVSPMLAPLLSNVARHTRLQTLQLYVDWEFECDTTLWLPPSRLGELLRTDPFTSIHTIRLSCVFIHAFEDVRDSIIATLQTGLSDSRVICDL